jgi:hypothetical protein
MWRDNEVSEKLLARRQARKCAAQRAAQRAAERDGSHPLAYVDPEKAYEWMQSQCAALMSARQAREDKLIDIVIQTSSAALLAIPGFLVASGKGLPTFTHSWLLASGALAFLISFMLGCTEQILSGKAYRAQRDVLENYYAQKSNIVVNEGANRRTDSARVAALTVFAAAVILSALGLLQVARETNDYASTAASSSSSPAPAAAASAAPSAAARTASAVRRGVSTKIESRPDNSAASEKIRLGQPQ